MPINKNLTPVTLPMDLKFGEHHTTTFSKNLRELDI